MTEGCAPVRMPFTTKPLRTELFSSWWLRVAAANFVSARELLYGFPSRPPDVPLPSSLDSCLDPVFLRAIAHFCRVPIGALQSLVAPHKRFNLGRLAAESSTNRTQEQARTPG
jgi:hypothetical protein